ncbi:MAG: DinB family protein [Rhodococcus sp. (in: high G+C Gram-positive bacteria)]|nr:MAG: DinB family protein [Rhodococcus sp. (in: high G+C Gram-positive bacteria)]
MTETPSTQNPISDEHGLLLLMLDNQRTAFRNALSGLTEEQARSVPSASEMSLASLLKHVIDGEEAMTSRITGATRDAGGDPVAVWMAAWNVAEDETVDVLLARFDDAQRATEAAVAAETDLERDVDLPADVAQWMASGVTFTVRYMLLHQIEELARHAGHADIIRQSLDGARADTLAGGGGWS